MLKCLKLSCRISQLFSYILGKMQQYQSFVFYLYILFIRFYRMALQIQFFESLKVKLVSSSSTSKPPGFFSTKATRDLVSTTPSYLLILLILSCISFLSSQSWYFSLSVKIALMVAPNRCTSTSILTLVLRVSKIFLTEQLLSRFFQAQGLPYVRLNYSYISVLSMETTFMSSLKGYISVIINNNNYNSILKSIIRFEDSSLLLLPQIIRNQSFHLGFCQHTRSFAQAQSVKISHLHFRRSKQITILQRIPSGFYQIRQTTAEDWINLDYLHQIQISVRMSRNPFLYQMTGFEQFVISYQLPFTIPMPLWLLSVPKQIHYHSYHNQKYQSIP